MPQYPFVRMHGAGNDYLFFDGFSHALPPDPQHLAPRICSRATSVGADGLIFLTPPRDPHSDVEMSIWNADGSAAAMCGTGARCVSVWMQRCGRVTDQCRIQVADRIVHATQIRLTGNSGSATVDMGPCEIHTDGNGVVQSLSSGEVLTVHHASVGNPHAVVFVDELSDHLLQSAGPQLERHVDWPERTNVEFVQVSGSTRVTVRVWERGSGETQSCGSGACAVTAVAQRLGLINDQQSCVLGFPGGELRVERGANDHWLLTGPVEIDLFGDTDGVTGSES